MQDSNTHTRRPLRRYVHHHYTVVTHSSAVNPSHSVPLRRYLWAVANRQVDCYAVRIRPPRRHLFVGRYEYDVTRSSDAI